MMEVYANGFAEHRKGYFISSGSASGVMTGQCALMGYQTTGFLPRVPKVFSTKQYSRFPNKGFLRILRQGTRVCAYSARGKDPKCVQDSEDSYAQNKRSYHEMDTKDKISSLLPKFHNP
jgi:hypothetical protein